MVVNTNSESVEESLDKILSALESRGMIPGGSRQDYAAEEVPVLDGRLKEKGYI